MTGALGCRTGTGLFCLRPDPSAYICFLVQVSAKILWGKGEGGYFVGRSR